MLHLFRMETLVGSFHEQLLTSHIIGVLFAGPGEHAGTITKEDVNSKNENSYKKVRTPREQELVQANGNPPHDQRLQVSSNPLLLNQWLIGLQ